MTEINMVKGNKANRAVSWGLVGLLGLVGGGCGPETMSIERAFNEDKIVYVPKEGTGSTGMLALEQFARDFESKNAGELYIPSSYLPQFKEGTRLERVTEYEEGYKLDLIQA